MSPRLILLCGLGLALLAVLLGAFGAHGLRAIVAPERMQTWQTASEYHFYHALGLIGLGLWLDNKAPSRWASAAALLLVSGLLLFSGSLYLLVLTNTPMLGMITPLGGLCFIAAWACWFIAVVKARPLIDGR